MSQSMLKWLCFFLGLFMTEQDCSPMGQRAKGKIPNNPLFKGSTLPSSCAWGEISNTRTFWGGQVKTITASSSQLSLDTRAPDCPSRTSVIQPSSTFLLYHCRLLPLLPLLRNPSQSLDFQEAWLHICCCTDGPPPDCPAGAHPVTLPTSNSSLNTCHQFHSYLNQ